MIRSKFCTCLYKMLFLNCGYGDFEPSVLSCELLINVINSFNRTVMKVKTQTEIHVLLNI